MSDLYYIEEGYLEPKYYVYIALGNVAMGPYIDEGYIEANYYEDYSAAGSLVCDAEIVTGVVVEAIGTWSSEFSQSTTGQRVRYTDSQVNAEFTQSSTVGKLFDVSISVDALFTPSLVADAFKNHTAVLESQFTVNADAVVNRATNVLLEHIANLNAQAAKEVVVSATFSSMATQTTSALTLLSATGNFTVSASINCDVLKLKRTSAEFNATSSMFVSRYTGTGRPRNLSTLGSYVFDDTDKVYGSHSIRNSGRITYQTPVSRNVLIQGSEDFVIEGWFKFPGISASHPIFEIGEEDTLGAGFQFILSAGTGQNIKLEYRDQSQSKTLTSTQQLSTNTWQHLAVRRVSGIVYITRNNVNIASMNYTGNFDFNSTNWISNPPRLIIYADFNLTRIDEVSYRKNTGVIAGYTQSIVNDPNTQVALYHFDNNILDDISVIQTGVATLTSQTTLAVQANPNTKQANADFSSQAQVSADISILKLANSDLNSEFSLSATIGTLEQGISIELGEFVWSLNEGRIRYADSTANALFTPTITVQATKVGEIVLASEFNCTIDANSFTEVPAQLASEFVITAQPRADYKTSAAIIAENTVYANGGKLKEFASSIQTQSGFNLSAIAFEGTGLLANVNAQISVSANRLRGVIAQPQSQFTQTADVRANLAEWDIDDYQIFTSGFSFSSETKFANNPPDGGQDLINVNLPKRPTAPAFLNSVNAAQINLTNSSGADIIFAPVTYLKRVGTNSYEVYQRERQHEYSQPSDTNLLQTDVWRTTALSTTNINQSTGAFTISLNYDGPKGTTTRDGFISGPHTVRILGNPNYVLLTSNWFWNPPANTSTLRSVSYTPTGLQYSLPYPIVASADLISNPGFTLTAEGRTVVFLTFGLLASLGNLNTQARKTASARTNITVTASQTALAGIQAVAQANIVSASTVSAQAQRARLATADLSAQAQITCSATRVRFGVTALNATSTVTALVVKRTGNLVSLNTEFAQQTVNQRIRFADSALSAFNTTVTIAAKNATGTVLLEAQFSQSTDAEKNAVGVISAQGQFTVAANTEQSKIVNYSADLSSQFTQDTQGDRIQPAGADVSAEFTQFTETNNSKTARITANITAVSGIVIDAERSRDVIALTASLGTLDCAGDRIRFGQSQQLSNFSILVSPTFIVRITADFLAFNTQLTVGDVINIDPSLQLKIEPESRGLFIVKETRIITIDSETRVNIIKE